MLVIPTHSFGRLIYFNFGQFLKPYVEYYPVLSDVVPVPTFKIRSTPLPSNAEEQAAVLFGKYISLVTLIQPLNICSPNTFTF
jgi:hypothetical protein